MATSYLIKLIDIVIAVDANSDVCSDQFARVNSCYVSITAQDSKFAYH
jgi:hypothetical protein